ncbi:MAG: hypothetical protein U9N87_02190 [Planctomycetota bacterium]|nr:hypothetical protein [Planctomycetota bacterium]
MARENQGLQIALIIFVITTILFGVMAFVFHNNSNKASIKAKANAESATRAENGLREMTKDMEEIKKMIGFADTDEIDRIRELSSADMIKYAATFPEETRNYRGTLQQMFKALREKNQLLDDQLQEMKTLTTAIQARENNRLAQIKKFEDAADVANKDKDGEISKFNDDRQRMKGEADKIAGDLKDVRKNNDTTMAAKQGEVDTLAKDNKDLIVKLTKATGIIAEVTRKDPKEFDGEIRWVNQASKTVWVNLGRADSLKSQTSFSVYPNNAGEVTQNAVKADIEITQVLSNHLAEGRIVSDSPTDPIMPGDKINSPVWSPGEKLHFSITGIIELDNDGRDDTQRLHTLIEMNGGAIDAKMDAKGKRQGEIGLKTRYLVLGSEPEGKTANMLDDWNKMQGRATELGVEKIELQKLLDLMGWKREADVLQYGRGAKGFEVQSQRKPGVSTGKISDLFKPRNPPRNNGGSTY